MVIILNNYVQYVFLQEVNQGPGKEQGALFSFHYLVTVSSYLLLLQSLISSTRKSSLSKATRMKATFKGSSVKSTVTTSVDHSDGSEKCASVDRHKAPPKVRKSWKKPAVRVSKAACG